MVGSGVLKGMWVTLRQFIGTYPAGRVVLKALRIDPGHGLFTIAYPEVKQVHPERARSFPFLVYDATPDNLRCVACRICEQECPPACIHITMQKDEKGSPAKAFGRTYPKQFDIDISICMSCRICVDVCPFDAIEMDNNAELSQYTRGEDMLMNVGELLRPNEYFQQIKPVEAATVDARLAAKKPKAAPAATKPAAAAAPAEREIKPASPTEKGPGPATSA